MPNITYTSLEAEDKLLEALELLAKKNHKDMVDYIEYFVNEYESHHGEDNLSRRFKDQVNILRLGNIYEFQYKKKKL
jgi:hypothetical protein